MPVANGALYGRDLSVAFASRTLITAENYPIIEQELLAIAWAYKYFRQYIYGRRFTIVTLTWIFSVKDPSSRLLKWRLKLEEYDYEVVYNDLVI
jgi:hypothetical protein